MWLIDAQFFRAINNLAGRYGWLDAIGIFCAKYLIFVIVALAILHVAIEWRKTSAKRKEAIAAVIRAASAVAMGYLFNAVISVFFFRPRPFVTLHYANRLIGTPATDKSFPSDHATVAFAVAFSFAFECPLLGWLLLPLAALVAFGRAFVGVHYPADVIAGALAGFLWAVVARSADRKTGLAQKLARSLIS